MVLLIYLLRVNIPTGYHTDCLSNSGCLLFSLPATATRVTVLRKWRPPIKTALSKKSTNKSWRGCGEKRTLSHSWWECKLILLWGTLWKFLVKRGIKLPYDPAIPLLGIYPEKTIMNCFLLHSPGLLLTKGSDTIVIILQRLTHCFWKQATDEVTITALTK